MRARLTTLIGTTRIKQVKMGTFHSLCARLLRSHGRKVGLTEAFTIMDDDERRVYLHLFFHHTDFHAFASQKLVGKLLKAHKDEMAKEGCSYTPRDVQSKISFAKGKGFSADDYAADFRCRRGDPDDKPLPYPIWLVQEVFREYNLELRRNNAVDFDDLLIYGVKLVQDHNEVVHWCRHILVDE
jgi:DNA helicase-2/ATP-dependent DNA helicase PcrA